MAWTDPRTWTASEFVTASIMNSAIRDNLNAIKNSALVFPIGDFAGAVITTGLKTYFESPRDFTISQWTVITDTTAGSITFDVWKAAYAAAPPTVANTITSSDKPKTTTQVKNQNTAVSSTAWTTSISAGDIIAINVDSCSTVKFALLSIKVTAR